MTRQLLRGLAVVSVLGLLAGCAVSPGPAQAGLVRADLTARTVTLDQARALPAVVDATRRLGLTLLGSGNPGQNTVVSPSSLAVALSMLSEGARGTSLAELEKTLGASGEERRDAFAALRGALLALDGDPAAATGEKLPERPIVHLASQVVIDDQLTVNDDFLKALADVYDAGAQYTDLGSEAGKKVLDAWANHHTGGLIKESAVQPAPDLRLVLQDALLLAARWQTPFSPNGTAPRPFALADGSSADVDTMWLLAPFAYAEVDGWKAARLPYVEALHAQVVLPPQGTDPAAATPELLARIDAALDAATPVSVDLMLPALDLKGSLDLLDPLADAGAGAVTCGSGVADLSGIALTPGELCVSQLVQQTVLKVHEEGTVAAALTEVAVTATGMPEPGVELHLDRPFLLSIAHTATDWPLFLAAVRDPRG